MKTLTDYRCEAVHQIELTGLVPLNMRAALENDQLVVFGYCADCINTLVQERASCQELNTGAIKIVDMVSRIRHRIETSNASITRA